MEAEAKKMKVGEVFDLDKRMKSFSQKLSQLTQGKNDSIQRVQDLEQKIGELRTRREEALLEGKGIKEINKQIEKLSREKEIQDDKISALERQFQGLDLTAQIKRLKTERSALEEDLLDLMAAEVREKCNRIGEAYAEAIRELYTLQAAITGGNLRSNCRSIGTSNWAGALLGIPRFYDPAEFRPPKVEPSNIFTFDPREYSPKSREALLAKLLE